MIAEDFLARLKKVRKNGERSWMACCPAHEDRSPSLKVTDSDGTLMIRCFAGCDVGAIVQALGIELHELFPPRNPHEAAQYRRIRFVKGTLKDMEHELNIVLIVMGDLLSGKTISETDRARAHKARQSIIRIRRELWQAQ